MNVGTSFKVDTLIPHKEDNCLVTHKELYLLTWSLLQTLYERRVLGGENPGVSCGNVKEVLVKKLINGKLKWKDLNYEEKVCILCGSLEVTQSRKRKTIYYRTRNTKKTKINSMENRCNNVCEIKNTDIKQSARVSRESGMHSEATARDLLHIPVKQLEDLSTLLGLGLVEDNGINKNRGKKYKINSLLKMKVSYEDLRYLGKNVMKTIKEKNSLLQKRWEERQKNLQVNPPRLSEIHLTLLPHKYLRKLYLRKEVGEIKKDGKSRRKYKSIHGKRIKGREVIEALAKCHITVYDLDDACIQILDDTKISLQKMKKTLLESKTPKLRTSDLSCLGFNLLRDLYVSKGLGFYVKRADDMHLVCDFEGNHVKKKGQMLEHLLWFGLTREELIIYVEGVSKELSSLHRISSAKGKRKEATTSTRTIVLENNPERSCIEKKRMETASGVLKVSSPLERSKYANATISNPTATLSLSKKISDQSLIESKIPLVECKIVPLMEVTPDVIKINTSPERRSHFAKATTSIQTSTYSRVKKLPERSLVESNTAPLMDCKIVPLMEVTPDVIKINTSPERRSHFAKATTSIPTSTYSRVKKLPERSLVESNTAPLMECKIVPLMEVTPDVIKINTSPERRSHFAKATTSIPTSTYSRVKKLPERSLVESNTAPLMECKIVPLMEVTPDVIKVNSSPELKFTKTNTPIVPSTMESSGASVTSTLDLAKVPTSIVSSSVSCSKCLPQLPHLDSKSVSTEGMSASAIPIVTTSLENFNFAKTVTSSVPSSVSSSKYISVSQMENQCEGITKTSEMVTSSLTISPKVSAGDLIHLSLKQVNDLYIKHRLGVRKCSGKKKTEQILDLNGNVIYSKEMMTIHLLRIELTEEDLGDALINDINLSKLSLQINWDIKNKLSPNQCELSEIHLVLLNMKLIKELYIRKGLGTLGKNTRGKDQFMDFKGNVISPSYIIPGILEYGVTKDDLSTSSLNRIKDAQTRLHYLKSRITQVISTSSKLSASDIMLLPFALMRDFYILKGLGCRHKDSVGNYEINTFNGVPLKKVEQITDHLLWIGLTANELSIYVDDVMKRISRLQF